MAEVRLTVFCRAVPRGLACAGTAIALAACASNDRPLPVARPPPPLAMPAPATSVYSVQQGDTLTAIARRAGVSVADLVRMNALADPDRLALGQRLLVPAAPASLSVASATRTKTPAPARPARRRRAARRPVTSPPPSTAPAAPSSTGALHRDRELVCVDAWIDEGDAFLRGARYEEAIESAQKARAALEKLGGDAPRTARLEVVSASAELALGRATAADASFLRALAADPTLRLDEATVSPKVVRAFEATRKAAASPRPSLAGELAIDGSPTAATSRF